MFKKGEYITIIGSTEKYHANKCSNWNSQMDRFSGKVVQLTCDTSKNGSNAKFDNCSTWYWSYYDKHFRLSTKEEILAGHLIENSEQNEVSSIQPQINNEYTIF